VTLSPDEVGEPSPAAASAGRLVLILDRAADRLTAAAAAVRALLPHATVLVLDSATDLISRAAAWSAGLGPVPTIVLVRADPDGWSAASVLAAHRPPRFGRPVDALLVAEGPLEKYSTLITDFPGLRLLPPGTELAPIVAALVQNSRGLSRPSPAGCYRGVVGGLQGRSGPKAPRAT
jgi:hypothetical protein